MHEKKKERYRKEKRERKKGDEKSGHNNNNNCRLVAFFWPVFGGASSPFAALSARAPPADSTLLSIKVYTDLIY